MYTSLVDVIADELRLDTDYIHKVICAADSKYRVFQIEKRNGKKRTIYQAHAELQTLQYWVAKRLLSLLPVSDDAFAYLKGKSIKRNAEKHLESSHVLHTDISEFFPSITDDKLLKAITDNKEIIVKNGLWYGDILDVVSKICFRKGKLCIGTVSSPVISNIVMYDFDNDMKGYCDKNRLIYSRYADDIYISSCDLISCDVKDFVVDLLNAYGYKMNSSKTSFHSSKGNIRITGLNVIDNKRLTIGTKTKEKVKSMIYKYIKYQEGNADEILGYLSYIKDIEPDYFINLVLKYSKYTENDLYTYLLSKR